mgnify:CR=1 FL=1
MRNLKTYDDYINEGIGNWIATAMMLVSLGSIPKSALSTNKHDVKEVVDNLSEKDQTSLEFINEVGNEENFHKIMNHFNTFKKDTIFRNTDFLSYLNYVDNSKKIPIGVNVILIDIAVPGSMLFNVPLYGINLNIDGVEINAKSGLSKDIYLDVDLSKSLKLKFMSNPLFTTMGVNIKF